MHSFNFKKLKKTIVIRVSGKLYRLPQSKLLKLLFDQYPQPNYLKGHSYDLAIPDGFIEGLSAEKITMTLPNDIVPRQSLTSQRKIPIIIHVPHRDEQGQRTIEPHVIYFPISKDPKAQRRFSVMDTEIDLSQITKAALKKKNIPGNMGIGSFGAALPVMGTVAEDNVAVDTIFKTHKQRILKAVPFDPTSDINKEAFLLLRTGHLGAKELIWTKERSYLLQRQGGKELYDTLCDDWTGTKTLTIRHRYEYSINFLKSILQQIHGRGIVSRDIKPENTLFDPHRSGKFLNIDFGLAKTLLSEDSTPCGSVHYVAPEVARKDGVPADERVDIFSAGLTLAKIWRMPDVDESVDDILKRRSNGNIESLENLFLGIKTGNDENPAGISESEQKQIQTVIETMLDYDSEKRASLEKSIKNLQISYIDYLVRIRIIKKEHKASALKALHTSKKIEEQLMMIATPDEYIYQRLCAFIASCSDADLKKEAEDLKNSFDKLDDNFKECERTETTIGRSMCDNLAHWMEQVKSLMPLMEEHLKIPSDPIEKLRQTLLAGIEELDDNPAATRTFIQTLELHCLIKDCATKEAMILSVNKIVTSYQENITSLNQLKGANEQQTDAIEQFKQKIANKPITLDELVASNAKITAFRAEWEYRIDYARKKSEYDMFFALTQRAFTLCEQLECSIAVLDQCGKLSPSVTTNKQTLQNCYDQLMTLTENFKQQDFKAMDTNAFQAFVKQHDPLVGTCEKQVNQALVCLHTSHNLSDRNRKKLMLASLELQVDAADTLEDLKKIYDQMQAGPYRFLRKERNWFRFVFQNQGEGTTQSWRKAIKIMQQKAYDLFHENYNVTSEQAQFLQQLFSEKQERDGSGKPYLAAFQKFKIVTGGPQQAVAMDG